MENKTKPIIKWTGGKYREFEFFKDKIPAFDRYIEPFFGGGGVFFALQPSTLTLINDKSQDLIKFYKQISESKFKEELLLYVDAWDEITNFSSTVWEQLKNDILSFFKSDNNVINKKLENVISLNLVLYKTLILQNFIYNFDEFKNHILYSIKDKLNRISKIIAKEDRFFEEHEQKDHFETAIKSGMYLYFRSLMNKNNGHSFWPEAKAVANWYFVREFCYASMFRYNANGEFNIPYGGIAYNKKNFRQKVEHIFSSEVNHLFRNTKIFNQDFEVFLNNSNLLKSDFIFLDPPYDSEFSEYDQNAFTQNDQKRLADFLIKCSAKWMVIIKETPFIREIYTHKNVNISTFDKNYTYNVRGRNERAVKHLIITNY